MTETTASSDWIDADAWIAYLRRQHGLHACHGPPLTWEQAEAIARAAEVEWSCQSDGTTLLRVGAVQAAAAKAAALGC